MASGSGPFLTEQPDTGAECGPRGGKGAKNDTVKRQKEVGEFIFSSRVAFGLATWLRRGQARSCAGGGEKGELSVALVPSLSPISCWQFLPASILKSCKLLMAGIERLPWGSFFRVSQTF